MDINYEWYIENKQYNKALEWILKMRLKNIIPSFMSEYKGYVNWNTAIANVILYNNVTKFYPQFVLSKITDWSWFLGAAAKSKNMKLLACMDLAKNKETFNDSVLSRMAAESGSMKMLEYFLKNYIRKPDWTQILNGAAISGNVEIAKLAVQNEARKNEAYLLALDHGNTEIVVLLVGKGMKHDYKDKYTGLGYYKSYKELKYMNISTKNWNIVLSGAILGNNTELIEILLPKHINNKLVFTSMNAAVYTENKEIIDELLKSKYNNPVNNIEIAASYHKIPLIKYFLNLNKKPLAQIDKFNIVLACFWHTYSLSDELIETLLYVIDALSVNKNEIITNIPIIARNLPTDDRQKIVEILKYAS